MNVNESLTAFPFMTIDGQSYALRLHSRVHVINMRDIHESSENMKLSVFFSYTLISHRKVQNYLVTL